MRRTLWACSMSFILFLLFPGFAGQAALYAQVIPVEIVRHDDGTFTLMRGGEPYFIKGAGGASVSRFGELVSRGGNSIRTWGIDAQTRSMLDEAHAMGLSVMLGLWVGRETDGFNYNDEVAVANQLKRFRTLVRNFRNHPALLAWGVGNEVEVRYSNLKVWDAINDIAAMIHEEDGNHPTVAVTAHISVSLANTIAERAPNLDILGVNAYAGISSVAQRIKDSKWDKPYMITEWGVSGPWEVGKTGWGAPLEPSSTQKARMIRDRYEQHIIRNQGQLLGSYAFLWGSKYEGTHTWFGLYVRQETTEMIDELQYLWSGVYPGNRAPAVHGLTINGHAQNTSVVISKADHNWVECLASDPDQDALQYEFLVLPESGSEGVERSPMSTLDHIPGIVAEVNENMARLRFDEEHEMRRLRLYVFIRDGQRHVATASFPFRTGLLETDTRSEQVNGNRGLQVYPNPAKDLVHVELHGGLFGFGTIQVFNHAGMLVFAQSHENGFQKESLDLGHLPDGIYLLRVVTGNGHSYAARIVKAGR